MILALSTVIVGAIGCQPSGAQEATTTTALPGASTTCSYDFVMQQFRQVAQPGTPMARSGEEWLARMATTGMIGSTASNERLIEIAEMYGWRWDCNQFIPIPPPAPPPTWSPMPTIRYR